MGISTGGAEISARNFLHIDNLPASAHNVASKEMTLMPRIRAPFALAAIFLFASVAALSAQTPATPPDEGLYASYFFGAGYTTVEWIVCGSTQESEGCFGSGQIGPFGNAGALIEGNPSVNASTGTVTRALYVVDTAAGSGTSVALNVYKKTDVVTSSYDTTTVTLVKTITLPLTGGSGAVAYMAANTGYLFIGTNLSTSAVRVQKSNLSLESIGGFSPPINVSSITTDKYGYVTVTFGDSIEGSGNNGFVQFGPNGSSVGDGGGAWFMLSTDQALTTATLPTTSVFPAEKLQVRPKKQN